jgi:branched-subunit amino acid aminotransferase/4-amino-4-deoxychorismate lyase
MTSQSDVAEDLESSTKKLNEEVSETCEQFEREVAKLKQHAERSRRLDIIFKSIAAVLAVATPAFVTFSATANVADGWKIFAIILTGIAGAATTLQATFGWKQAFMRDANAALNLRQIVRVLRGKVRDANSNDKSILRPGLIQSALDEARKNADEAILLAEKSQITEYGQV